jgi:tetratricopeptide (TPR) repeat protein
MLLNDELGNPFRATSADVRAGIDDFIGGLLAYETRAEGILAAAQAHPDAVLAQVYAGWLWMFLESPQGPPQARPFLQAAERALRDQPSANASDTSHVDGTPDARAAAEREARHVKLLAHWVDGDLPAAQREADALIEHFPRDLLVVKLRQYFAFNRGDSPAMLRAILRVLPFHAENAYAHGMAAFAYEQCHLLAEAEAAARRALALKTDEREPWAQHALAHVLLTTGRIEEGTRRLEGWRPRWTGLNSFMSTHLAWHLALFYLARGRDAEALALYDGAVWGVSRSYSQDQAGAVQLLARLEWCGVDVGHRWSELAGFIAERGIDTVEPFLTLLYLYGLARAGRPEAEALLAAVREADHGRRAVWADVVWPAANGLVAHARGEPERAWHPLSQALPGLVHIGGSHAQRDLFALLYIDAATHAGELVEAQQALEAKRRVDPDEVAINRRLAGIYRQLDLPSLAEEALRRVARVTGVTGVTGGAGVTAESGPRA